ncbi:gfo/Idh/MocA family oxidoreductase [Pontibacillus yanchengensis]|uniref:Gfo/Idh/MocA family oxidoreductase n=1 Tax=Pontibacillus yanchengensis TaxID=462910 RepID=A0A6I5A6N0_9BACI|nr:Gfo/Idh/MocA family oxidoreductase [Pontibacillus yanchengensis]MYL36060.1 gfo/Idh/MocA family oxidoreductase [Pontibacillus yanchengensis]
MRWGILGAANIAKKALIPALQRANAEIVAIASRSGEASQVAEEFGITKGYDAYEELLADPDVDAVYIPVPNHVHKEWVIAAAQAGKHILCEKPAALTVQDVEEMLEECRRNNVYFLEAFMYQFHPQHERVKELIIAGEIGEVQYMRATFSFMFDKTKDNIRLEKEKGGGALWDVGCYGLHSTMNILDSQPTEAQIMSHIDERFGIDTTSLINLTLENGKLAQIDCSFNAPVRNEYQVMGTKGKITVPHAYRPDNNNHRGVIIIENEDGQQEEVLEGDQYKLQVEAFMRIIENGGTFDDFHELTLHNVRMIEALYKQQNM